MAGIVDLDRYPVHDLDSAAGRALRQVATSEFEATSMVIFPDFLRPGVAEHVSADISAEGGAGSFRFIGSNDVFLGTDSVGRLEQRRVHTKSTLAYDRISERSPLKRLFHWDPLLDFVSVVVGHPVFRSADKLGAMTVHIHHAGDAQDWHFDVSEYTLVLHLCAPREGGVLEYMPRCRSAVEEDHALMRHIAEGHGHEAIRELPTVAGTLVLHSGRLSMHRVTPVRGDMPRLSATMSFNPTPGVELNEYTRNLYFGRSE